MNGFILTHQSKVVLVPLLNIFHFIVGVIIAMKICNELSKRMHIKRLKKVVERITKGEAFNLCFRKKFETNRPPPRKEWRCCKSYITVEMFVHIKMNLRELDNIFMRERMAGIPGSPNLNELRLSTEVARITSGGSVNYCWTLAITVHIHAKRSGSIPKQ